MKEIHKQYLQMSGKVQRFEFVENTEVVGAIWDHDEKMVALVVIFRQIDKDEAKVERAFQLTGLNGVTFADDRKYISTVTWRDENDEHREVGVFEVRE